MSKRRAIDGVVRGEDKRDARHVGRAEPYRPGAGQEPAEPPQDEHGDTLPAELDTSAASSEPYVFPNNNRRRLAAVLYWVLAGACLVIWLGVRHREPVLVNDGWVAAAVGLGLFGLYSWAAGYDLAVDQRDALVAATRAVGFPVGHASAQLRWRGLRSRPTWYVLVYAADEPPTQRGLVRVDGVDGQVLEHFVEDSSPRT